MVTRVRLADSVHHLPVGAKAIRRTSANRWMELTLGVRRAKDLPDLSAYDKELPKNRKYMTRKQLADEFGSAPDAIADIKKFAAAHNLVVTKDERASARLGIAGTVANLSAAFGVTVFNYSHPQLGQFHAHGSSRTAARRRQCDYGCLRIQQSSHFATYSTGSTDNCRRGYEIPALVLPRRIGGDLWLSSGERGDAVRGLT